MNEEAEFRSNILARRIESRKKIDFFCGKEYPTC